LVIAWRVDPIVEPLLPVFKSLPSTGTLEDLDDTFSSSVERTEGIAGVGIANADNGIMVELTGVTSSGSQRR
jgi:hypothetical protein